MRYTNPRLLYFTLHLMKEMKDNSCQRKKITSWLSWYLWKYEDLQMFEIGLHLIWIAFNFQAIS